MVKTLTARIFIVLFCMGLSISSKVTLNYESFFGEYEYSNFVALYEIKEERLDSFTNSIFKSLIITKDYCSVGFYKNSNPVYKIVYPDEDGVVETGNRSYTCSYFIDLLTENRKYKQVILIDDCCVVEILDETTLAIHAENGWFVYKRKTC